MRTTGSRGVGTAVARILLFLTTLIVLTKLAGSASAQTWTGAANGNWNKAGNWSPSGVPVSSNNTQLIFGAATNAAMTNDIPGTFQLNQFTFNSVAPVYS